MGHEVPGRKVTRLPVLATCLLLLVPMTLAATSGTTASDLTRVKCT
jgi:hypothetical protein